MNPIDPIDPDNLASDALAQERWEDLLQELASRRRRQAFADAASHMSQEDWDADNDWLASAGWGEM